MYWKDYLDWIIPSAKEVCFKYDLPWQVVVAQGAEESQWGKYIIGDFNLFGRKYGGYGRYILKETQEFIDGEWITEVAKFQDYDSLYEAICDWCELMNWCNSDGSINYKQHSDQYRIDRDLDAFIVGIGSIYATNPDYADNIIRHINDCDLRNA